MRPHYEVGQIIRDYGEEFRSKYRLSSHQLKTLHTLEICRTATLGGHVERCDNENC